MRGPDAVDPNELIESDLDEQFYRQDQRAELPPEPAWWPDDWPDEAPGIITRGCGDSDQLDYLWSLNHHDSYGGYDA